jgi:hypothetical protein
MGIGRRINETSIAIEAFFDHLREEPPLPQGKPRDPLKPEFGSLGRRVNNASIAVEAFCDRLFGE